MEKHWIARNDEEEQLALALAIEQSLKVSDARAKSSPGARASNAHNPMYPPSRTSAVANNTQQLRAPAPFSSPQPSRPSHLQPSVARTQPTSSRPYQPTAPYATMPTAPYAATPQRPTQQPPQAAAQRPSQPAPQRPAQPVAQRPAQPVAQPPRKLYTDPNNCAGCGSGFWGSYISALDRRWHPNCFKCGFCSEPISLQGNSQFAVGNDDKLPYHADCHKHKYHPICQICGTYIQPKADGRIEYKENPFWREKYCSNHQLDNTPQCCACSRFQKRGDEWVKLDADGRDLCLDCLSTVVVDTKDAQPLYNEVMQFYRDKSMALPSKAPLMLVDGNALNDFSSREGKDRTGGPVFHVRGLTMATVYRSIPSIVRSSRGGMHVDSVNMALSQVSCNVTGILVMFGLPRLLTGCILAHELCHAWLRMKNVAMLDPQVEEGLCQLMAYIWLEEQDAKIKDPLQRRLATYWAYQIREDTSVVYGDGFRAAYDAFQRRGLPALFNSVMATGRLPA